jgi:hypothetical protein
MRNVIPQNIKDALQDLPDGLQQQVLEYLQSLELSPQPAAPRRGGPRFTGVIPADDMPARRTADEWDGE